MNYDIVAPSPPTLLEEMRNRQSRLALLLAANGDERANLLRQAEDLTKAIAALSPVVVSGAAPVPVSFAHQQPERFRYHVRAQFSNGRLKSSFHESLDEAEEEFDGIMIDPLLVSVTLEDVPDPASVTLLRQHRPDVSRATSEVLGYLVSDNGKVAEIGAATTEQTSSQASSIDAGQESRDSIAFWAAHPDGTFTQMPPDWKLGDDTQRTAKKVLSIKVVEAGFIPWEGGECEKDYPDDVAYDAWVEVILSGGKIQPPTLASAWDWNRLDNELNIIAYRIIGAPAGEAGALVNQTGDA